MAEVRTTSRTGGQKGTKLQRHDLIPGGPLSELAEHFGVGASKYADNQWRQGYEWSKSYAALMRHLLAFWAGQDFDVCSNDPDGCSHVDTEGRPFVAVREDACFNHTGSHHMAAVAWHAFVLLEFKDQHPDFDDRHRPALAPGTEEDFRELASEPFGPTRVPDPTATGFKVDWRDPAVRTASSVNSALQGIQRAAPGWVRDYDAEAEGAGFKRNSYAARIRPEYLVPEFSGISHTAFLDDFEPEIPGHPKSEDHWSKDFDHSEDLSEFIRVQDQFVRDLSQQVAAAIRRQEEAMFGGWVQKIVVGVDPSVESWTAALGEQYGPDLLSKRRPRKQD